MSKHHPGARERVCVPSESANMGRRRSHHVQAAAGHWQVYITFLLLDILLTSFLSHWTPM